MTSSLETLKRQLEEEEQGRYASMKREQEEWKGSKDLILYFHREEAEEGRVAAEERAG
jgi:hypothetical protein